MQRWIARINNRSFKKQIGALFLLSIFSIALLSACTSGPTTPTDNGLNNTDTGLPPVSTPVNTVENTPENTSTPVDNGLSACDYVTVDEMTNIVGVSSTPIDSSLDASTKSCTYEAEDGSIIAEIQITSEDVATSWNVTETAAIADGHYQEIEHLGDKAFFRDFPNYSMHVQKDGLYLVVFIDPALDTNEALLMSGDIAEVALSRF